MRGQRAILKLLMLQEQQNDTCIKLTEAPVEFGEAARRRDSEQPLFALPLDNFA